jgi:hypothetical protein
MSDELKYRIKVEGDIAAAPKAAKAIKEVTEATKEMQKAAEQSAKRLEEYFRKAAKEAAFLEKASREAQRAGAFTANDFGRPNTKGRFGRAVDAYKEAGGGLAGLRAGVGSFGAAGAASLAAGAAAAALAAKSLHEYAAAQERVASLDAALAQRGQLNDAYRKTLHDLAQQQEELTSIDSTTWFSALSTLTQSGAGPENIQKLVEATKNYAGIMGGDLQSGATSTRSREWGSFSMKTPRRQRSWSLCGRNWLSEAAVSWMRGRMG